MVEHRLSSQERISIVRSRRNLAHAATWTSAAPNLSKFKTDKDGKIVFIFRSLLPGQPRVLSESVPRDSPVLPLRTSQGVDTSQRIAS
jgi:hypothetical protein